MNRRSFITKALAGLAAIPVIGKLAQPKPTRAYVVGERGTECFFPACAPPQSVATFEDQRAKAYSEIRSKVTGGTFTLTDEVRITEPIPYDASQDQIDRAIHRAFRKT